MVVALMPVVLSLSIMSQYHPKFDFISFLIIFLASRWNYNLNSPVSTEANVDVMVVDLGECFAWDVDVGSLFRRVRVVLGKMARLTLQTTKWAFDSVRRGTQNTWRVYAGALKTDGGSYPGYIFVPLKYSAHLGSILTATCNLL